MRYAWARDPRTAARLQRTRPRIRPHWPAAGAAACHRRSASMTVASPRPAQLATATSIGADHVIRIDQNDAGSPTGDGYDHVIEEAGATIVGNLCVPLARNGGTALIYGVTKADEILSYHPIDVLRRDITIKGSFAEMTSFGAAVA